MGLLFLARLHRADISFLLIPFSIIISHLHFLTCGTEENVLLPYTHLYNISWPDSIFDR